ncbi:MAG TPA: multidrug ABC transporter ATP-binding protein [Peptococcaceae bacterium]|nr:multidrug ABC transporter ATP-binding protein [Peptococcaceae bacterium]
MIRLIRYTDPYRWGILIAIVLLFGQATCDLALPDFMSDIVNEGIASGNTGYIIQTGFKMLGVSLLGGVCSITVGFLAARIAAGLCQQLRIDLFEKVESFSNSEFDKFSTSSLITRTTNDITQIQTLLVMLIRIVFYAPILGIGGVIHALANSKSMSWIIGVALVLLVGLVGLMMMAALPKFKLIQVLVDKLNQVVRENLDGMLVIRAFNTQRFEENRFDQVNTDLTRNNLFVNRTMAGMMPAMMLIMNLITVLVIWVGSNQVSAFKLDVGDMMAYMQYVMQIIMAFLMMSMMFIMIPRAQVSANRIADVLETEPSILSSKSAVVQTQPYRGVVEFRHVTFAYPEAEDPVLHDISFIAEPGQTTAIIGSTGSGKSTLVNLIPRFYDVTAGQILIDGVDIRDMKLEDLRKNLGYVPQKGILFSGTIHSNLAYADKNASEAELLKAAEIAQALEFIEAKPEGFHSEIAQGGSNVSGGQKQRLSIARAMVKKPQIYLFDDSFSALDFKTDAALRNALKKETGSSTVFLVAQRISTIMTAEQIIVLDAGRIAGIGTHQELMETCQVYREIGLSQLSAEELA